MRLLPFFEPSRMLTSSFPLCSDAATSLPASSSPQDPWRISPVATAQRLLRLVCLLRIFLNYPGSSLLLPLLDCPLTSHRKRAETERIASEAIVYYASCFADSVGADFAEPSLDVFASFWLDKNSASSLTHTPFSLLD